MITTTMITITTTTMITVIYPTQCLRFFVFVFLNIFPPSLLIYRKPHHVGIHPKFSVSWYFFWFFLPSQKKSLGKRKKVKLCTDIYDWYTCLEYQYIEHDTRNLMSIFLAMANDAIKSYSWNNGFFLPSQKNYLERGKK